MKLGRPLRLNFKSPRLPNKTTVKRKEESNKKKKALAEEEEEEETAMNSISLASNVKSAVTGERSESRNSSYFPGCRKDMNCNCEICLASIKATLDLVPSSIQGSSLTKMSNPESTPAKTPISSNPRFLATPTMNSSPIPASAFRSTAKSKHSDNNNKKNSTACSILGLGFRRFLLCLSLIIMAEFGFPWAISGSFGIKLSPEIVKRVAEESGFVEDLNGRLGILQRKLGEFVHKDVTNCSASNSNWVLNQDGLQLLHSCCILYKSAAEEVSVWGWPLQTAGLLVAGFSSRSFTILSGRIAEWPEGRMVPTARKANNSWTQQKLSSSAVQLEPNTWIVEYRRSRIVENGRVFTAAMEFLKLGILRVAVQLEQEFWVWARAFPHQQYTGDRAVNGFKYPT